MHLLTDFDLPNGNHLADENYVHVELTDHETTKKRFIRLMRIFTFSQSQ